MPRPWFADSHCYIHTDIRLQGMHNYFEAAATHLLPDGNVLKIGLSPPDAWQPNSWHWKEKVLRLLIQLARSQAMGNQVCTSTTP